MALADWITGKYAKVKRNLEQSDFRPEDSQIASAIMHPVKAGGLASEWFRNQVNQAANQPDQYDNPDPFQGYSPEQQTSGALNLAGLLQTGAMPFAPSGEGTLGSIKAFHGAPYQFDKFDLHKIGNGQGAQAYGHGLYFAENPEFAKKYMNPGKDKLFNRDKITYNGISVEDLKNKALTMKNTAFSMKDKKLYDKAVAENYYWDYINNGTHPQKVRDIASNPARDSWPELDDFLKTIEDDKFQNVDFYTPSMYDVSLEWPDAAKEAVNPLSKNDLLDLDRAFYDQSKNVKKSLASLNDPAINEAMNTKPTYNKKGDYWEYMGETYDSKHNALDDNTAERLITGRFGSFKNPEEIRQRLNNAGIPGSRYTQSNYGENGKRLSNYVIFNDKIPKIKARNGVSLSDLLDKNQ